jgi:hypothetical protein
MAADKMAKLLAEIPPSPHATRNELCDALLNALEKRSPLELRQISDGFADVGMKHLAELCRTLADRLVIH